MSIGKIQGFFKNENQRVNVCQHCDGAGTYFGTPRSIFILNLLPFPNDRTIIFAFNCDNHYDFNEITLYLILKKTIDKF